MAQKIANLRTADSNEDISSWCNLTTRPLACAALFIAESGLKRYAWRDKTSAGLPDDVSGGLAQVSIQYMPTVRPPVPDYDPKLPRNSPTNIRAWSEWSWDIPSQMAWFLPHFDALADWAEMGLDPADAATDTDADIDFLTCLLWNAPNLGILRNMEGSPLYPVADPRQRVAVANYWLSPRLKSLDPQHAANRDNYARSLVEARKYLVDDGSTENGGGTIMPDITDYTEPTLPTFTNPDDTVNVDMLAACVKDLQNRFIALDRQQHYQTDALGVASNPDYDLTDAKGRLDAIVKQLRGG